MNCKAINEILMVFLVSASTACFLTGTSQAQTPPPANLKLLSDAKSHWINYENNAKNRSIRVRTEYTSTKNGSVNYSSVDTFVVKSNSRSISIEKTDERQPGPTPESKVRIAKVVNKDYEFEARQEPKMTDWSLTALTEASSLRRAIAAKEIPPDRRTTRDEIESDFLLNAVSVDNLLARVMIEHGCCQTVRFAPVSLEPGALVEWQFTIDAAKRPSGMRKVENGSVLFDPAQKWVVKEYAINNRNGTGGISHLKKMFSYRTAPDGYPVPDVVKIELVTDDKSFKLNGVERYELIPHTSQLPDTAFTLSAYGIPEEARAQRLNGIEMVIDGQPSGPPIGKQTPVDSTQFGWYIPLAICGVVLLVIALIIRLVVAYRKW